MERIKINLPEHFSFHTNIPIRITDLNYGGHVGNDTFLSLMQEARQQFLVSHGYQELDIEGLGVIMTDAAIEYKKELNYGDTVKISVAATGFHKYGFDVFYKLEIIGGPQTTLAAKAKTGMHCYNYAAKKLASVPEKVREKLSGVF